MFLSESSAIDPGVYWRKLKQRLKKEGSEVVTLSRTFGGIAKQGGVRNSARKKVTYFFK